uniref:Putative ovule protein n=1 Tax=Solanum chacoense TaxID=4108 RepID=A0A0V0H372_SOLCH
MNGSVEKYQNLVEENLILKVGNDNEFKFCRDGWIDQTPLSESFPDLFSIQFVSILTSGYANAGLHKGGISFSEGY